VERSCVYVVNVRSNNGERLCYQHERK